MTEEILELGDLPAYFDATGVPPPEPFTPVPAGKYPVTIVGSGTSANAKGTGHVFNITWVITDGEHKGRKLFSRFNIRNESPKAEAIAKSEMAALCIAANLPGMTGGKDLAGKKLILTVIVTPPRTTPDGKQYGAGNEVKGYESGEPMRQAFAAVPAQAMPQRQQPPQPPQPQQGWGGMPQQQQLPGAAPQAPGGQPAPQGHAWAAVEPPTPQPQAPAWARK